MYSQLPHYPFFNLIVFIILCMIYVKPIYSRNGLLYRQKHSEHFHQVLFCVTVILFSVFAFTAGDFYNYFTIFVRQRVLRYDRHLEDVYVWLTNTFSLDYLMWRLVVWGPASVLMIVAFKRMRIKCIPAFASIAIFYLLTFYIMRGNLGTSIMLLGLAFIFFPGKRFKIFKISFGFLLIVCSYYFHKSMLLSLGLLIPALYNLSKKELLISFCVFPFAVAAMKIVLMYLGNNGLDGTDEMISDSAQRYSQDEMFTFNIGGIIQNTFIYLPTYLVLVYAYTTNLMNRLPRSMRFFFNYWFIWVYMASVCAFQDTGGWFYSRFIYMSNLPLAVFMGYVFQHFKNSRVLKAIIISAVLGCLYVLLYSVYKQIFKFS